MTSPLKWCTVILAAVIIAAVLRLPALERRPMHTDEAVHAYKFGRLLEENWYRYNPHQYHGPTLNYFTLVPAFLAGQEKITDVTESTMRIVPVFFGLATILLLLLLRGAVTTPTAALAAILAAVSPALTFYSRYYIQESLFVCFTFAAIVFAYRYFKSARLTWAALAGLSLGLAHATKETFIIVIGAMTAALFLTYLTSGYKTKINQNIRRMINPYHTIIALAAALFVSALFHSSFFKNPAGILDSYRTYTTYFDRAAHNVPHIHPWYYYIKMLLYSKYSTGPVWTEALIVILAVAGVATTFVKKTPVTFDRSLIRFIAFYTIVITLIYALVPYKTPWCMLGFLQPMTVLAAVGAVAVIKTFKKTPWRAAVSAFLVLAVAQLAFQAYRANFRYYADTANPYVYAHTSNDIYKITERIQQIARIHPNGKNMQIHIFCAEDDYWPLPWYLRSFPNTGFFASIENIPPAPVIIASEELKPAVLEHVYSYPPPGHKNLYVPLFDNTWLELRPGVPLIGLVATNLWQEYRNLSQDSLVPSKK